MKVGLINTFDNRGGAARAAMRLLEGLSRQNDPEASMHVLRNETSHPKLVEDNTLLSRFLGDRRSQLDLRGLTKTYPNRERVPFSVNRVPDTISRNIASTNYDLINLHWINYGFLRLENFSRFTAPIVWTIHDMWPFTGVCHYSSGCQGYLEECGNCPLLHSQDPGDISNTVFRRKSKAYADINLTVVSPSRWLGKLAEESRLLGNRRVEVIPNGIDTDIFSPYSMSKSRNSLGIPKDACLVLFGAEFAVQDPRKGGDTLFDALRTFPGEHCENLQFAVFGATEPEDFPPMPFPVHWLGRIEDDDELSRIYSAADLAVVPSKEENLPNTVMEALSCGTPVVAFDIGGMADMIEHGENGWLTKDTSAKTLAETLGQALGDTKRLSTMRETARRSVVTRFSLDIIAARYTALFAELTD